MVLESEQQVHALREQKGLANDRFYGGVAPYLEVLDSDQQLFDSELKLTQDRANQLLAVIALYRAWAAAGRLRHKDFDMAPRCKAWSWAGEHCLDF